MAILLEPHVRLRAAQAYMQGCRARDNSHACSHEGPCLLCAQEYAAGGELFERIIEAGRLPEAEARFFFQQLISGIAYCHKEARHAALLGSGFGAAAAGDVECSHLLSTANGAIPCGFARRFCKARWLRCACLLTTSWA